jgi:CheY-like chemotaxis protein
MSLREFCDRLRTLEGGRHMPILLNVHSGDPELRARGTAEGADGCLVEDSAAAGDDLARWIKLAVDVRRAQPYRRLGGLYTGPFRRRTDSNRPNR